MAQKVQVLLLDDLDGSTATETVSFGLDGVSYEIDLNEGNAKRFRKDLADYVEHARKTGNTQGRRRTRTTRAAANTASPEEMRTWLRENGETVKDRGRVPANLVAKYDAAH